MMMLEFHLSFQETIWTPSKMIARLGREIDNPDSVYYWAYKVWCKTLAMFEMEADHGVHIP